MLVISVTLLFARREWKSRVMLVYTDCFSRHFIWISFRLNHSSTRQIVWFLPPLTLSLHTCVFKCACLHVCKCAGKLYSYCYLLELQWPSEDSQICFQFRWYTGCNIIKLTCVVCPLEKRKGVIDGHELVMESIFSNTYIIPLCSASRNFCENRLCFYFVTLNAHL